MTKTEALAKLEAFTSRADKLTIEHRNVAHPMYLGELHRTRADCYRIAIALVREIDEGNTDAE